MVKEVTQVTKVKLSLYSLEYLRQKQKQKQQQKKKKKDQSKYMYIFPKLYESFFLSVKRKQLYHCESLQYRNSNLFSDKKFLTSPVNVLRVPALFK